jgi:2',3'-cyclic-nucleotide 2'-phosphodiesterase (5'-nucleotidase family)
MIVILSSCRFGGESSTGQSSEELTSETTSTSSSEANPSSSSESSGDSSSSEGSERPTSGTELINFYAVNDVHGAVSRDMSVNEPGLARIATYLKDKKDDDPQNTVILASGDMWQGSVDSNYNRGNLVTEVMNDIGFDSMTIGNHEFDWGTSYIEQNAGLADFPFLGANIMQYPNTSQKSNIGENYTIIERGFLKVGIIGIIGSEQITDIMSGFVQNIHFQYPYQIAIDLSAELRDEQNCDIVVLSMHGGADEVYQFDTGIGDYFDAVFCAHSHSLVNEEFFGVPIVQAGGNGKYVSNISLTYDYATDVVDTASYGNTALGALNNLAEDASVKSIIDEFGAISNPVKNEVLGTITNSLSRTTTLPNMANYAVVSKLATLGLDVDFVMTNRGRANVPSGTVTYGTLFKALPFDNNIVIIRASGADIKNQAPYNNFYRVKDYSSLNNTTKYTLAVIDFLALHQDIYKTYNYFEDYNPSTDYVMTITDEGNPTYPRDILSDLFRSLSAPVDPQTYTGDRYDNLTI